MKNVVISSSSIFNPILNPGKRLDAAFCMSLGAIEQGRLDLLRECFDGMFYRTQKRKEWWVSFRKATTFEEAEKILLHEYGVKPNRDLPPKFKDGMRALLRQLLSETLIELQAQQAEMLKQASVLQQMLGISFA